MHRVEDKTKIAERLSYKVSEIAGTVAPRSNHAKVSLHIKGNKVDFDGYLNLETINDERFLKDRWPETHQSVTLYSQAKSKSWASGYGIKYALHSCKGKANPLEFHECERGCDSQSMPLLKKLVDVAGTCSSGSVNVPKFLEKMDRVPYLTMMAVENLCSRWNGPCADFTPPYGSVCARCH